MIAERGILSRGKGVRGNQRAVHESQEGFAALVIALTLVIIVGLITVGFAQLMRSELNQTTNRQLSNQAYYAAESGVNDAAKALSNGFTQKKTTCGPITSTDPLYTATGAKYLQNNSVGSNAQWTCLLIDSAPDDLEYGDINTINPTSFVMQAQNTSGNTFSQITFYWQSASSSITGFRGNSGQAARPFPTVPNWGSTVGVLRLTLTPLSNLSRPGLISNTFTVFLYPTSLGNNHSLAYATGLGNQGQLMDGSCNTGNTPRFCSATITGLNYGTYLVTMRSIYSDTAVTVKADNGNTRIADAQTMVDSTGRDQDVLKRIQVRIPNKDQFYLPGFGVLDAGPICKQLGVYPGHAIDTCSQPGYSRDY